MHGMDARRSLVAMFPSDRRRARMIRSHSLVFAAGVTALAAVGPGPGYHVVQRFVIGGPGRWDYVALDTIHRRLFVARETRVTVLDPESGKLLGEIPGLGGAHGVAFAYDVGRGFATSGRDSTVTMFDLNTFQVLGKLHAG